MGKLTTSLAEKRMLQHIQLGGSLRDPVGSALLSSFAAEMASERVAGLMVRYQFTTPRLAAMYAAVVEALMPNPTINAGGPMLVPTALFMEPHRLEAILWLARRDLQRDDASREGRDAVDPEPPSEVAWRLICHTSGVLPVTVSQEIPEGVACLSRDDRYTHLITSWAIEWAQHIKQAQAIWREPNPFPITPAGGLKQAPNSGCLSGVLVALTLVGLSACAIVTR